MFERFTSQARATVVAAQTIARDLGDREIGDQHLLLALLDSGGITATVLRDAGADAATLRAQLHRSADHDGAALMAIGIDLDEVRRRAEATFGPGALDRASPRRRGRLSRWLSVDHLPFTQQARQVLQEALRAARDLGHDWIGTEHVLLGLLADADSLSVRALRAAGVELDRRTAEAAVRRQLDRPA